MNHTVIFSLILAKRFSLIPLTFIISSIELNGPFVFLYSIIALALDSPIPVRVCNSSLFAILIFIFPSDAVSFGTIAPCGAIGSIVFVPEKVLPAVKYYATLLDGKLIGDYGFKDAFNFENGIWIASNVIGIDKGITVLMIENYRSEIIWKTFMNLDIIKNAISVLQFTKK